MCMRACRHGQPTAVTTPVSPSIGGFSSSTSLVDFDKHNRKYLLGDQMLCQLEKKWKNVTWRPCCWLGCHFKFSSKECEYIYRSCPIKFNTFGSSSVGHGSLHQISRQCIQQESNRWRISTAAPVTCLEAINITCHANPPDHKIHRDNGQYLS